MQQRLESIRTKKCRKSGLLKLLPWIEARKALFYLAASSLACGVSVADDTEIYTGQGAVAAMSNVLFIIDNSGSMTSKIMITPPYDPSVDYDGACSGGEERIYWSAMSDSEPPDCSSDNWFLESANRCASANGPLGLNDLYDDPTGRYLDRLVKALVVNDSKAWVPLDFDPEEFGDNTAAAPLHVECGMDQPNSDTVTLSDFHGETLNTDAPYIHRTREIRTAGMGLPAGGPSKTGMTGRSGTTFTPLITLTITGITV